MYFLYKIRFMIEPYSCGLYVNILGDDTQYKTYKTRWGWKLYQYSWYEILIFNFPHFFLKFFPSDKVSHKILEFMRKKHSCEETLSVFIWSSYWFGNCTGKSANPRVYFSCQRGGKSESKIICIGFQVSREQSQIYWDLLEIW